MVIFRFLVIMFFFVFSELLVRGENININAVERTSARIKVGTNYISPLSSIAITTNTHEIIKNRHSLSLDFGPTLFSIGYFNLANIFVTQPDGVEKRMLSKTFGIGFNYSYLAANRVQLDMHIGINTVLFYFYNEYIPRTPSIDFGVPGPGDVESYYLARFVDIPIYFSTRFYLGRKKDSGFFIAPKIGANLIFAIDKVEKTRVSIPNDSGGRDFMYNVSSNEVVFKAGLFTSLEIGTRINLNIESLNRRGIKSFLDISFIDIGYYIIPYHSKKFIFGELGVALSAVEEYEKYLSIRLIPLPKIAFGVSF